jgi:WD40 repeat protein
MLVLTLGGYQLLKQKLPTTTTSSPATTSTPSVVSPAGFSLDKTLSPVPGIDSIAFSPDGKTLATGGYDYEIALWELGTGKERKTLEGHKEDILSVAFSPDGKTLARASDGERNDPSIIKIWRR